MEYLPTLRLTFPDCDTEVRQNITVQLWQLTMAKHILSVSYDESLLKTRELLLRREGYDVTSALGFTQAVSECQNGNFDLFILGHSIPDGDKRELIRLSRLQCAAPVLALRRHGEEAPDGADEHVNPQDIKGLLKAVSVMLSKGAKK